MKISLNWIKEFTDIKLSTDELVAKIGAQLGEVEEVVDLGERYQGIVIAKVVECERHPNADKLSVCKIDDGGVVKNVKRDKNGLVQVVCGAPNVRKGLMVAWIPSGAVVPSTYDKERFTLEARELRGIVSNGMLASGHELAINDDHSGILEVDEKAEPGTLFADVYQLNDVIIDIENKMFTHRPDCFGILGVAREIAGIQHLAFASPEWYTKALPIKPETTDLPLKVINEIPELCPRYMAVALKDVTVQPSPIIMQSYLSRLGIKPVNNVVDVTNFMMLLTAQPLHAFDYDKVAALDNAKTATIMIRKPEKGEKISLLNGKTIEPRAEAIMIASKEHLIAIGGVMGGASTEVDDTTKNIILECANFDMYSIRKTSMEHGLFTDAVTRFNKGQSFGQLDLVLQQAVITMQEAAGGVIASEVSDTDYKKAFDYWSGVDVDTAFINDRLGIQLSTSEITKLLTNVEFDVQQSSKTLVVSAPFWRTDIHIPEDIIEEVGRLYGYDKLPLTLPERDLTPAKKDTLLELKKRLRSILSSAGANEVLTYSFVHGNLLEKVGQDAKLAFRLSNALSPDLQYYRLSLTPSLLEKIHPNIKAGTSEFALFEIGKAHDKKSVQDGLPSEEERLAFVFTADKKQASSYHGSPYYQAQKYAEYLLSSLGFEACTFEPSTLRDPKVESGKQCLAPFERGRTAYIKAPSGEPLGVVGEIKQSVKKNLKLPLFTAAFELDILQLLRIRKATAYRPLSRFPKTQQDISFRLSSDVGYASLETVAVAVLGKAGREHGYTGSIEPLDIYQDDVQTKVKHIALRLTVVHPERTLVTEEVNRLLEQIAQEAQRTLKAQRL